MIAQTMKYVTSGVFVATVLTRQALAWTQYARGHKSTSIDLVGHIMDTGITVLSIALVPQMITRLFDHGNYLERLYKQGKKQAEQVEQYKQALLLQTEEIRKQSQKADDNKQAIVKQTEEMKQQWSKAEQDRQSLMTQTEKIKIEAEENKQALLIQIKDNKQVLLQDAVQARQQAENHVDTISQNVRNSIMEFEQNFMSKLMISAAQQTQAQPENNLLTLEIFQSLLSKNINQNLVDMARTHDVRAFIHMLDTDTPVGHINKTTALGLQTMYLNNYPCSLLTILLNRALSCKTPDIETLQQLVSYDWTNLNSAMDLTTLVKCENIVNCDRLIGRFSHGDVRASRESLLARAEVAEAV